MIAVSRSSFPFNYSPELLETILNIGDDYICVKDRKGRFVYLNDLDASLYNATPQDMIGKTTEPWVGKKQFQEWVEEDFGVMDAGKIKHFEVYPRVGKDGVSRWFETVKIPFRDHKTEEELLLVIHRDVTAIKEAEIERNLLREKMVLSQKMETIGLLSASVAHDFNNMLTIILASSRLLTDQFPLSPKAEFLSQNITKSAERAAEVVARLLILSRQDKMEVAFFDLKKRLEETYRLLHAVLGAKIQFKMEIAVPQLPIHGNASLLEQALINLVLNARDALLSGGEINLVASVQDQNWIVLEVKDNGTGMTPEVLQKAFDPFFTTKSVGQGSGLGLVVVQRIVEQHQGTLQVESEVGQGTRFILKFPRVNEEYLESEKPAVPRLITALEGKTVLLVEDEKMVRDLMIISLESMGMKVLSAPNGDQAWDLFQQAQATQSIDCLLTDVVMDGKLDGVSLRKKIFADCPEIPAILMTGYSFHLIQQSEVLPGQTEILNKPFLIESLRDKLQGLFVS